VYFTYLFAHILEYRADGLWAGHVHVWGDWSLHIAMANIFAYKAPQEWFAYHPYYAYGKFTYGFITNMISGLLIRGGLSLPNAFIFPSIIFSIILVYGLYVVYFNVLKTQKAAVTAVFLFFCSSGLGFLRFIPDLLLQPTLEHLFWPTRDYSRLEVPYQWLAGNWVTGMLMPQRAYLLGMAITVWVMACIIWIFNKKKNSAVSLLPIHKALLVSAGVAAGFLPITHMHSFIVLIILCCVLGLVTLKQWKIWLWFAVPAGIISTLFYLRFVKGGIENPNFMSILIGWTAPKGENEFTHFLNWLKMWWEIWGLSLPVSVIGVWIAWKKLDLLKFSFLISGFVVFLLANIVLFQPIQWDNSKLFMWAYFFFAALMTLVLQHLWRVKHGRVAIKGFAIFLAVLLTATGFIELARLLRFDKQSYLMASTEDMELGQIIRQYTNSQSVFMIAPTHNHPAMEWGVRPILLGYPGWAYNFGFMYQQREADIHTMYKGGPVAEELLKKYKVSYVSFGPAELYDLHGDETYYQQRFPLYIKGKEHRIYDVRALTGGP